MESLHTQMALRKRLPAAPIGILLILLLVAPTVAPWKAGARAAEDACSNTLCLAVTIEGSAHFHSGLPTGPSPGLWTFEGVMTAAGLSPTGPVAADYSCWGLGNYEGTVLSLSIHNGTIQCWLIGGAGPSQLFVEHLAGPIVGPYASLHGFLSDGETPPVILTCGDPWFILLLVVVVAVVVEGCKGDPAPPPTVTCRTGETASFPVSRGSSSPAKRDPTGAVGEPQIEAVSTQSGEAWVVKVPCIKEGTATIDYSDGSGRPQSFVVKVLPPP